MKQKYTITVADMEMNVVTDADESEVQAIVGVLDRRMRDISMKSRTCSKVEAAILCALGFCAERVQLLDESKNLEKELAEANRAMDSLRSKLQEQKAEIDRLKNDNDVMHTILERAAATNNFTSGNSEQPSEEPKVLDSNTEVKKDKNNRNRVGNMFDLLTFGDV